jgi:hypothetical protein
MGMATQYSLVQKAFSSGIPGLGSIKHQTTINGFLYVQDDSGQIWKESTKGQYNFARVRNPGGNGAGMIGDQYGNLYYACGSSNNQLGKFDGSTWNDSYQTLNSGQHPMTWYEDLVLIGNNSDVACVFSDGSYNAAAFSLPTQMTTTAIKSGPTGILIGANRGSDGAIILWDGDALRSKTPWKWVQGQILAMENYGVNWIVKTQREVIVTNGYTIGETFGVFDDPLSFNNYDSLDVLPQQMAVINGFLVFLITTTVASVAQYGKMKPGLYLYSFARHAWSYIPSYAGATFDLFMNSVIVDTANSRVSVAYSSNGVNYIDALVAQPPTQAQLISEELGIGRVRGQRIYFGPTDKTVEAVVLNLGILDSITEATAVSFNASLKIYNFKRQLWGHAITSAQLTPHNQLQVDATIAGTYDAQIGDEVTVLEGPNAGEIGHITAIANDGLSNETWTLDTGFANATDSGVNVQVQPFKLVKRQTFSNLTELKNVFFSVNSVKGKQFLLKIVLDGITPGLALELLTSYWVFNDLGYSQT